MWPTYICRCRADLYYDAKTRRDLMSNQGPKNEVHCRSFSPLKRLRFIRCSADLVELPIDPM